ASVSKPFGMDWLHFYPLRVSIALHYHLHYSYITLKKSKNEMKMDLKIGGGDSNTQEGELGLKEKDVGSISSKDMFFRADKIDFKSWDLQLEKHLSWVWSRDREVHSKREEWEIDLAKLDIRNVIAHGTYGTVYRGTYDGQDVADVSITYVYTYVHALKVLDWGEDGIATAAETAALRASFRQEFIGASMGTSNLKIPSDNTSSDAHNSLPSRACCVVVEYLPGGMLKKYLIRNWRKKLAFGVVIQLALDLSRGLSYLHSSRTLLEPYFVDLK
ncbi:Serine/threonine-protein kinase STY13, partial [Camellia lanceoleosa]